MKVPIESNVTCFHAATSRSAWAFAGAVTFVYLAVATFAIWNHEMWRDELHCWLVARDSPTPWEVVRARAYDGQPPLWYLLLWVLTRLTWHPQAMQAVHLAIATANVLLASRFAPFGRAARALFAFGYFAVYEYAAISRCYGVALLLVILLCLHHPRRFERPVTTGLLLAGLALTTTVATLVASAYVLTLVVDAWPQWRTDLRIRRRACVAVSLAAIGAASAALCAWPPRDSTVAHVGRPPAVPWDFGPTRLVAAFLPIPRPDFFFWNSNAVLDALASPRLGASLGVILFAAALWLLSGHRTPMLLFSVGTALLVGLFAGIYAGDTRHHGFIFVLFFMAAWIACRERPMGAEAGLLPSAVTVALALHLPGAAIAIAFDARYVFSSGARAARELRARGLADALIVAEVDYPATAVLGQLGPQTTAFSPRTGRAFSFVRWTADRFWEPSDAQTVRYASALGALRRRVPVLLMNRPLRPELVGRNVTRIAELYDSMVEEENFYLYRVTPSAP
jgi:hypothetical protein